MEHPTCTSFIIYTPIIIFTRFMDDPKDESKGPRPKKRPSLGGSLIVLDITRSS
jgi:hypothetical protein